MRKKGRNAKKAYGVSSNMFWFFNSPKGALIASSSMGVTVFDLFNEIITRNDMIRFISDNGITEQDYEGAALILRCFLLLMDLNKANIATRQGNEPVEIKVRLIYGQT